MADTAALAAKLDAIERAHPDLKNHIRDARKFAKSITPELPEPSVWSDGESEVVFEWIDGGMHVVVSCEGDGSVGYAIREDKQFAPGALGSICVMPYDLRQHLSRYRTRRDSTSTGGKV